MTFSFSINVVAYNVGEFPLVQLSKIFERKIATIFLLISLNMCFGCSKEPSH